MKVDYKIKAREYAKRYRENNKEKIKESRLLLTDEQKEKYKEKQREKYYTENGVLNYRKNILKRYYGIKIEDYNRIFDEQNGCCKICNRHQSEFKRALSVDHCHNTNTIRGLLCNSCNRGIGYLQDSVELLKSSIEYLQGDYSDIKINKHI